MMRKMIKKRRILGLLLGIMIFQFNGTIEANAVERTIEEIKIIQEKDDKNIESFDKFMEKNLGRKIEESVTKNIEKINGNLNIIEKDLKWNGELDLSNNPKKLVMHHIEASRASGNVKVEEVHQWHLNNGWTGIGYHFYINKKGEVYRGRPENAIGAHASKNNIDTIGIAVEGRYETENMPKVQKEAVIELGKYLRRKYNINTVVKHKDVNATTCPGKNYPFEDIKKNILSVPIGNGWQQLNDGKWYYLNENGQLHKGWLNDKGNWYYLDNQGVMVTGWGLISGVNYYFESNGCMKTGWLSENGKWYYFNESGNMMTGWVLDGDNWYYIDKSGVMMTGWIYVNGINYYLNNSGVMVKGWLLEDNNWYYLNESGMLMTGWQFINNEWYYMYGNGVMATNTTIDNWVIGANGIAVAK